MVSTSPRRVALNVLNAVITDGAYANLALPTAISEAKLDARDAGFATELTYGTLREQGLYDAVISAVSARPFRRIDQKTLIILRLGAHQLLAMQTPPHAAVSESVSLARKTGVASAAGFVNATLRRIGEQSRSEWITQLERGMGGAERLSLRYSHPAWIVEAFEEALSEAGRAGEISLLLEADNVAPAVNYVSLPEIGPPVRTNELGWEPDEFSPVGFIAPGQVPASVTNRLGVRVQDEGSQLAALALSAARPIDPGERWLDMCAGPGGKAALLAAVAVSSGAEMEANEVSEHRAELVRQALRGAELDVPVHVGDGRTYPTTEQRYERILLDAPCTGLGALRRRPEARWRKQASDIDKLVSLQKQLIESAIASLAPGGLLAYVTCSPHRSETIAQCEALMGDARVRLLDSAAVVDSVALRPMNAAIPVGSGTVVQLWPHRHRTDAMFIALYERVN